MFWHHFLGDAEGGLGDRFDHAQGQDEPAQVLGDAEGGLGDRFGFSE
jgi:hypothetical protein